VHPRDNKALSHLLCQLETESGGIKSCNDFMKPMQIDIGCEGSTALRDL